MNKVKILIVFLLIIIQQIYSQYNNGNGTIIQSYSDGKIKVTVRKHIQRVQIGTFWVNDKKFTIKPPNEKFLIVFNNPNFDNSDKMFKLSMGDYINIYEIHRYDDLEKNTFSIWLKIKTDDNKSGYLYYKQHDYYDDDTWIILEIIKNNEKTWTARKLEQTMSLYFYNGEIEYDVYDKPNGNTVFKLIENNPGPNLIHLKTISITEETENINNKTEHWVKIIDKQGRIGWIFGEKLSVERGGAKYLTPDNIILSTYYMYNFNER